MISIFLWWSLVIGVFAEEGSIFLSPDEIVAARRRLQGKMTSKMGSHHGRGHNTNTHGRAGLHGTGNRTKGVQLSPLANVIIDVPKPWGGIGVY